MLKGILKQISCLYCGFNRWLERVKEIFFFFYVLDCLLIAQVFFMLFTVFVIISCELDTLNLY